MSLKKIAVRYPIPSKTFLKQNALQRAQDRRQSVEEYLSFYIKCREDDINKENVEILKSKKRIRRASRCIAIAKEIKGEINQAGRQKLT